MGGHTVPAVLGTGAGLPALPLEIVPLYFELDGTFPNHEANPLDPANLVDLQAAVASTAPTSASPSTATPTAASSSTATARRSSPSAITGLVATREIARARAGGDETPVVHNVISSAAVPEIVAEAGARPVRTRVGHSFIKAEMARDGAVFGGEHSAHYYFRDFWFADTGMLAAMHVLAALGEQDGRSRRSARATSATSHRARSTRPSTDRRPPSSRSRRGPACTAPAPTSSTGSPSRAAEGADPRWWFNVRASNTEPLLRLNVEAADRETMERLRDELLALIRADARPAPTPARPDGGEAP